MKIACRTKHYVCALSNVVYLFLRLPISFIYLFLNTEFYLNKINSHRRKKKEAELFNRIPKILFFSFFFILDYLLFFSVLFLKHEFSVDSINSIFTYKTVATATITAAVTVAH